LCATCHIDLLRIRAEGSEFEILNTLLRGGPVIPILCAEFTQPVSIRHAHRMLRRIADGGYELTSIEIDQGGWTFTALHEGP
jgi:hypothetical protein